MKIIERETYRVNADSKEFSLDPAFGRYVLTKRKSSYVENARSFLKY